MADKTTTLTTQTGDSIYPNVLDENIPDTIARVSNVNKLKTDVETAYLTKANAEATYQTKAGRTDYVSKTYGDGTYATITQLGGKQDKLTAGSNITIEGTTIAATRPENRALYGDLVATDGEFTGGTGGGGSSDINFLEVNDDSSAFTGDINPNKVNVLKFPENTGNAVLSNIGSDTYSASFQVVQEDQGHTYIVDYIINADSTTKAVTMNPQMIWVNTPDTRAELMSNALTLANALTFYKHFLTMSSKDSYFVYFSFDCPKDIELSSVSAVAYSSKKEVRLLANGYVYRDNKEFPVAYVVLKTNHSIGINYFSDKNTISEVTITEATVTDNIYNYTTLE